MLKIGLTGGIGSGKTTIAKVFGTLGYPIYFADTEASRLMNTLPEIKNALIQLFGENIYQPGNTLNKQQLATLIFNDAVMLKQVNSIVHPEVIRDFLRWSLKQHSPFVFFESAILFEAGLENHFDYIICVSANFETRVERVMKRDRVPREKVTERIRNQEPQEEKNKKADFIIDTTDGKDWQEQLVTIKNVLNDKRK